MEYLHYQLHVSASILAIIRLAFNLSRDYTICMVYWGGGGTTRYRFTIVGSMKIRTSDRVTNIWCQYLDLTCLRAIIEVCYVSTVFNCMLSGVGVVGRLHCIVRGVWGVGCIINLRLLYRWVWSLWVKWVFFSSRGSLVVEHLVWTGSSQVSKLPSTTLCYGRIWTYPEKSHNVLDRQIFHFMVTFTCAVHKSANKSRSGTAKKMDAM
jgi:hypothetical protein